MSQRATGAFDVKVVPQKPDTQIARAANLGRLTIDKRFHGDLEGISKGEMLVLQHSATMTRGTPASSITVVPDSGTGELRGLSGKMNIIVGADGAHTYEFVFGLEADD